MIGQPFLKKQFAHFDAHAMKSSGEYNTIHKMSMIMRKLANS